MHEYILYSQIPAAREGQVLNILAGVTGTQPVPIAEQTLIYAQVKLPEQAVSKKTKQQQQQKRAEPLFHKLQRTLDNEADDGVEAGTWMVRTEQTPDPGVQAYISREVTEKPAQAEDLARFRDISWYRYRHQYTTIGNRYVHGNLVVRVARYWIPEQSPASDPLDSSPLPMSALKLLDPSGVLVIELIVRVGDTTNSKVTDQAKQELQAFQTFMDGAVDFYTPDRLSLDTRVRNT